MKLKVMSVYDAKIEMYAKPFFMMTRGEAVRAWTEVCNDEKSPFYKYPEDYTLFELGEYDEENGRTTNHNTPQSIGIALEFKKQNVNIPRAGQADMDKVREHFGITKEA